MPQRQNEWDAALLRAIGAPLTPGNRKFLRTWQRWEGGHTNNSATYNWLNTTHGTGSSINSVGVKAFPDFQTGIHAIADTLHNGRYDDILQALWSGHPFKARPVAGLETWVSGSPTGNPSYAQKILGSSIAVKAPRSPSKGFGGLGPSPAPPQFDPNLEAARVIFDDDPDFLAQIRMIRSEAPHVLQQQKVVSPRGTLNAPPAVRTHSLIQAADSQIGKPYLFGSGPDTSSFDCSDLIQWAYAQIGITVPRTTFDQIHTGRAVSIKNLQPGDLIFPTTHHVVMYVGDGRVIAAPHTGTVVQYQPLSRFSHPVAIRRVLP